MSGVIRRWLAAVPMLAVLVACGAATAAAPHPPKPRHWRVAWTAAMDDLTAPSLWARHPTAPGSPTPPEVTYRFIARPTASATGLRLRFSNSKDPFPAPLSGTRAVTFASVRIGVRAGTAGARVLAGTNTVVTFGGKRTVTIAPGGTVLSDRVALSVRQFEDLAVSVYVPRSIVPPMHPQSYVTQYLTHGGAGDRTATSSDAAFTGVQEPIYWLDAVDALTRAPRAVVTIGDSITDGDQCGARNATGACTYGDDFGMNKHPTYPDFLVRRIASSQGLAQTAVVNEGVNGDSLNGLGNLTIGLKARLGHDLLLLPGVTDAVLEIGTNDLTFGMSGSEIIEGLKQVVSTLHRHRLRVVGATLVPRGAYTADKPAIDAARAQVNRFIRTSRMFDGVLDIARAVGRTGNDNLYQPQYDSGDHLHPNTAGYRAIARSLRLSLL